MGIYEGDSAHTGDSVMIFEIVTPRIPDPDNIYIKPLHFIDAWDAYEMLDKCFPYNHDTYTGDVWQFFICCFNGYDNCLQFRVC